MIVSSIASARKLCFTGVLSAILALALWMALSSRASAQTFGNVTMGGGGYVTGIITCPTQTNLIYCKTDVGGAYRWDEPSQTWIALLDWCSQNQTTYQGVESLAIDPQTPAKVYILAGTSYWNGGATAILRSSDYGNTFAITDVTAKFKANGNGSDRQKGETLAVDPNLGNILFCGSRANGLFKSTDSGVTWNAVGSLNVGSASISFVELDPPSGVPGTATPRIFVGVFTTGTNLYVSNDAGVSWTPLTNSPSASLPQRCALASDRNLYITYGNGANGAIMKYNLTNGIWANCSPNGAVTYCGISVCATNPLKLVAATYQNYSYPDWGFGDWGDLIFVSNNGGTNWNNLFNSGKVSMNANGFPWIVGKAIHWAGALEMDPFNSDRVYVGSGNGIFSTTNLNSGLTTSTWKFTVKGLEETVPLNFISVPGGPFITSIGDYGGFIHTNIAISPPTNMSQSSSFACAAKTNLVARVVYNGELYYSKQFPVTFANKMPSTPGVLTNGSVAIAADGSTVLWKSVVGSIQTCYVTTNLGTNWTLSTGLNFSCNPEADAQNPLKFYAYNSSDGYCYVSTDGGLTFAAGGAAGTGGSSTFCTAPGLEGHVWIALNNGGLKYSTNSGATFYSANVTEANAVAFGKTAPGATYPTLFIWGRPASTNVPGMYRSLDQAATWVSVNDTNHQYGGRGNAGLIEGDKNICGRVYMSSAGRGVPYMDSWVFVTNITVVPVTYSIPVNGTVQLTASVWPTNASNPAVTWASSNAAIATVSGAGLVTGNLAGTTTITATTVDGSFVGSSVITVTNASTITSYWMDQNGNATGFGMADATTYYWLAGTPWTTDNSGNFAGGGIAWPNGNNAVLVGAGPNTTNTVQLGTTDGSIGVSVGNFGLNWNLSNASAIGAGNVNIGNPGDTGVLTLAASSTAGVASGILTINNPINLGGNSLNFSGGSLFINGAISGTGNLNCQAGGGLSGATVTLAGANTYSGTTTVDLGSTFNLGTNGAINSGNTANLGQITLASSTSAKGTLNISGGTVNATKSSAPSFTAGTASGASGVINLGSGTLTTTSELWLGGGDTGITGFGALSISGGTATTGSYLSLGRSTGSSFTGNNRGELIVSGGSLTVSQNQLSIGSYRNIASNTCVAILTGGTTTIGTSSSSGGSVYVGENANGILNVSGSAALNVLNVTGGSLIQVGYNTGVAGIANLNGGTVTTPCIRGNNGTSYLNSNGGKLKANAANAGFIQQFTGAYIYSGGLTIDDGGFALTVPQNLLTPATGNGVSLGTLSVSGSGFNAPPIVDISGTGTGASAIMTIDGSGILTGVTLTSPGVGYTGTPTFTFTGGGSMVLQSGSASTAANASGGLTKLGNGTLTLSGANTYSGGTTVNAGTLALKNVPASGTYSISSGATMDLQSGTSLSTSGYATFSGAGTLKLSTALSFGGANTTNWIVSLNPGGLIWVTDNSYINGSSYGKGFWTNNLGSLQVDVGSTMNFVEAGNSSVQLDALLGGGTITAGYYASKTLTIGAANGSGTFSGTLTNNTRDGGNPLSLTKVGSGTQTLSGGNGYTGATTVSAGTLLVNSPGSLASGSAVTVAAGATLGGNGTIAGVVTNTTGGSLSPGTNGVGILTLNGILVMKAGSTNPFVVNGSTPTNNSVVLGASVTYGGVLKIVTNGNFTVGQSFRLFSGAGATTAGNFASIAGTPGAGKAFSFTNGVLSVVSSGPTLTSVTPNPVNGSSYAVTIGLVGSGFTGATAVLLTNVTAGSGASYPFVNGG